VAEANEDEETVVLKEEEDEPDTRPQPKGARPTPKERLRARAERIKSLLMRRATLFVLLFLVVVGLFVLLFNTIERSRQPAYTPPPLDAQDARPASVDERRLIQANVQMSSLDRKIAKAGQLYAEGSTASALDLYEEIALFSESLSLYNLGVARMRQGEIKGALEAFETSLAQEEHRTVSAINGAVCALKLDDEERFNRLIATARESLPLESTSPLFGYYYALVNYYSDRPFHALAAANTPTIDFLGEGQRVIAAKMHLIFDDALGTIDQLEALDQEKNLFSLGLLYARAGEYSLAADRLQKAISADIERQKARAALLLVHLKSGFFRDAGNLIEEMKRDGANPLHFPITVKLKERLFDVNLAQNYFSQHLLLDERVFYQALFHFTPYLMIDPNRAVSEIKKGQVILNEGELEAAREILSDSRNLASTNARVTLAVRLASNNRLLMAHDILLKAEQNFRNNDILQYNLALSYAQLGNFPKAYRHFRRAYFLNHKNTRAGVYAAMTAPFAGAEEDRLVGELSEMLQAKESDVQADFYLALLGFYSGNLPATAQWLERNNPVDEVRHDLLDLFAADRLNRPEALLEAAMRLKAHHPKDLLVNIFHLYAENKPKPIRRFAFDAQSFMESRRFNFDTLFYGPPVVRDLYIQLGLITGNLRRVRSLLQERLSIEQQEVRSLMRALAQTNIYLQNHEEAFVLMNELIDRHDRTDSDTLLTAAVAAIGAGHKENAIILLQLAKGEDGRNQEARYGLGLLYMEVGNAEGAAVEFGLMQKGHYESRYFDFDIRAVDDPELLTPLD
jgi:tetratricopeptide (TPR) repeat protein